MAKQFNLAGSKIRSLRVNQNLSQKDLAAKIESLGLQPFSRETLAKVESDLRLICDYELVFFAHALKVDISELLPSIGRVRLKIPHLIRKTKRRKS